VPQVFPNFVSGHYRFENDDGSVDSSTFIAAEDTTISQDADAKFRLRMNWGESAGQTRDTAQGPWLQYNINGSAWVNVGATTAVQYASSTNETDGTSSNTDRIVTAPTGCATYIITHFDSDNATSSLVLVDEYNELTFNILIDSAQVTDADTINFQMAISSSFNSYDTTPSLTVNIPAGGSQTISDTDFIASGNTLYEPASVKSIVKFTAAFIAATSALFSPDVTSTHKITDVGFISSTATTYLPAVTISGGGSQTINDTDFIGSGNTLYEPVAVLKGTLQGGGTFARYFMNEAGSGTSPTDLIDASGVATLVDLPITYNSLAYFTAGTGKGLDWTSNVSSGRATTTLLSGKLWTIFNAQTKFTIEQVIDIDSFDASGSFVYSMGGTGAYSPFAVYSVGTGGDLGVWFNDGTTSNEIKFAPILDAIGRSVMHIVWDSTQTNAIDRLVVYVDGVKYLATSGTMPALNSTLAVVSTSRVTIGNRATDSRSIDGRISYTAVYNDAFTEGNVNYNTTSLLLNDDPPQQNIDATFIASGNVLYTPTVVGPAISIARYKLDEASSGQVPTTCTDDTGNGNTLAIDYSTDQLYWNSIPAGNGLDFQGNDHLATVKLDNIADNGNIGSSLDSVTEASLVLRLNMLSGDVSANRAFYIGLAAGNSDFSFNLRPDIIEVRWNEELETDSRCQYDLTMPTGVKTIGVTVDTTELTQGDRVKLYLDGVLQTTKILDNIVLDSALTGVNSTLRGVCIGNRNNGARGGDADVYYAELFTGKLTATEHATAHTNLTKTNESDWATVQFVDAGFIASTATTYLPGVTLGSVSQTINDLDFIASGNVFYNPKVGRAAVFASGHYRFENDDDDFATSTFIAAEDTPISILSNTIFRLRLNHGDVADQTIEWQFFPQLQYNINGGLWADVGPATPIQESTTVHNVDGDINFIERLTTPPTGITDYLFSDFNVTDESTVNSAGSRRIETSFSLIIDHAQVTNGDTINLQIINAWPIAHIEPITVRDTFPSLTVTFTQVVTDTDFISSGSELFNPTFTGTLTISDVGFIASGSALYTPDVTSNTQKINDTDFITSGNILYSPTLTSTLTITDVGFIASGNALFNPDVTPILTIPDVDFIPSGNVLFTPTVNAGSTLDLDFIPVGATLYNPTFTGTLTITDVGFIASGNTLFLPAVGKKPIVVGQLWETPKVEGQVIGITQASFTWNDATSLADVGDTPPDGLTFVTVAADISYLSGTLSNISAGTYNLQHSATNAFGTTLSPIIEYVVKERIQPSFIPSGNTLYNPELTSSLTIPNVDFIASGNALYSPDVIPTTLTIPDVDFISSTTVLYTPDVTALVANQIDSGFIISGNQLFEPTLTPGLVTISDTDFIPSGSATYLPVIGKLPKYTGSTNPSPQKEGNFIAQGSFYSTWTGADSGASIGDIPDGLVYYELFNLFTGLSGTLSYTSAGTYNVQFSATNQYGTSIGPVLEFVVKERIQTGFIASTTALYEPTLTPGSVTISDTDFIASGNSLFEPTFTGTLTIQDIGFIASGNVLFATDVGIKPTIANVNIKATRVEGESISGLGDFWINFNDATQPIANVGDTPPNLSYETITNVIAYFNGILSDTSAGTYNIQFSATNSYGTTLSPIYEVVVLDAAQADFIPSGNILYEPTVVTSLDIDLGFIGSTTVLYDPTVVALVLNQIDCGFLISGNIVYNPTVAVGPVTLDIDYIASGNALFEPTLNVGQVVLSIDYIASSNVVYNVTMNGVSQASADYIASGNTLFNPTVSVGAVTLDIDFISATVIYDLEVKQGAVTLDIGFIPSTVIFYEPLMTDIIVRIDVIEFNLHIDIRVDKILYVDKIADRVLYIERNPAKVLNLTTNYDIEVEL
jgi:hypothetical protein